MPRKGETLFQVFYSPRVPYGVTLAVVQGAVNVWSDLYILRLPIPGVWQLQLPLGKKIGVSAMFLTGLLCMTCSNSYILYRAVLTWYSALLASITGLYYRARLHSNGDVTFDLVLVLICVSVSIFS